MSANDGTPAPQPVILPDFRLPDQDQLGAATDDEQTSASSGTPAEDSVTLPDFRLPDREQLLATTVREYVRTAQDDDAAAPAFRMPDRERAELTLRVHQPDGAMCAGCRIWYGRLVAFAYCTDRDWATRILMETAEPR